MAFSTQILAFTSGDANLSFRIVVMVKEKFGKMDFSNFVGYLFWLNNEFREKIPARPDKEDILTETMGPVRNQLWKRLESEFFSIYVIIFFSPCTRSYVKNEV